MAVERAGLKIEDIGWWCGQFVARRYCAAEAWPSPPAGHRRALSGHEFGAVPSACRSISVEDAAETLPPYVLVVDSETMTKSVNYADRSMAVLFGDGSAATVVSTKVPSRAVFCDCRFEARPQAWKKVGINYLWRFYQDGNAVQGFAIRTTTDGVKQMQDKFACEAERFIFIGHQANLSMLKPFANARASHLRIAGTMLISSAMPAAAERRRCSQNIGMSLSPATGWPCRLSERGWPGRI